MSASGPAPVVAVRGIARHFGDAPAVGPLAFDVGAGELFGIVGPDGAGKTTLLRMLAGVLRPTEGDALVLGASLTADPDAARRRLAYMAQRFGLYEDLTVRENIDFYADLYRVPRADRARRLERLYAFSNLGPFEDRLVGRLSGGMKQKAALCCALIHRPALLLLDEPTFGVDPISRRDLWLILHEMALDGMTIVLTTSYLDEAERCDRVLLLDRGRALAGGPPAMLLRGFRGRLVAVPAGRDRQRRARIARIPGVRSVVAFGDRLHVALDADADRQRRAAALLRAEGIPADHIEPIAPTLEDVFLHLTGAGGRRA
jgi:ABC-2 type transport system ATP-binding protein